MSYGKDSRIEGRAAEVAERLRRFLEGRRTETRRD